MAHFQLIPGSIDTKTYKSFGKQLTQVGDNRRLLLRGTGRASTPTRAEPNEAIFIHTGTKVKLQQLGHAGTSGTMPTLYSQNPAAAYLTNPSPAPGDRQNFTLEGKSAGVTRLGGKNSTGDEIVCLLTVCVGDFEYHSGMACDLIAEKWGRSDDARRLYFLQRFLNSNYDGTNPFNQTSDFWVSTFGSKFGKELVCESVCLMAGEIFFGQVHGQRGKWNNLGAHKPLYTLTRHPPTSNDHIQYIADRVGKAKAAIAKSLLNGVPVCVGCAHHALSTYSKDAKALLPYRSGGHYILIVGCDVTKTRFLYIDPWFGGSQLQYSGGITSMTTTRCQSLGLLEIDNTNPRRGSVLAQASSCYGSFSGIGRLEVLTAPTH